MEKPAGVWLRWPTDVLPLLVRTSMGPCSRVEARARWDSAGAGGGDTEAADGRAGAGPALALHIRAIAAVSTIALQLPKREETPARHWGRRQRRELALAWLE